MSTSGVYTYTINRDTLIASAFRTLGVFNDDSPAPATDIANAAQALNLMIKQWMSEGYLIWCVQDITVPFSTGKITYTLGPTGDVVTFRPLQIDFARLSYANGIDVPLVQLSRQEYNMLSLKTSQGTPNSYYYDKQLTNGDLSLYLSPDITQLANTVKVTAKRPLMDMSSSTTDFDFPVEALNALKNGLASELINEYDIPERKADRIMMKAERLKQALFDSSQEDASIFFSVNNR